MNGKKEKILTYKITPQEFGLISGYYGGGYEVIDESSCFEDVLAIPAAMIVINPAALTDAEYDQLNDLFQWDPDTFLVFTAKPERPDEIRFSYYVEDDFSGLDGSSWQLDEQLRLKMEYESAVKEKDQLLSDIDTLITPAEGLSAAGKTAELINGTLLYCHFTDLIRYMKNGVESRERTAFRHEITNILLSVKFAYGLIGIEDVTPFDNDLSEDSEWMIALAETIRSHRNNYLEHGNHLYVPKKANGKNGAYGSV
ncbi:MAG: hypothetical protein IK082_01860 [Oscillospiraceae bacterium]|nr:hypothetical protein [Oscillospiraceae bacterium]